MTRIRTLLLAAVSAAAVFAVTAPASADTCYDRYGRPYGCYYYDRPARYYAPPPRYYYAPPPPPRYYYPPARPGFSFYFSN
jgi:hypothetical protein